MIILFSIDIAECRYLGWGRIPLILLISYQVFEAKNIVQQVILTETVLVEIIHGVFTVPSAKNYHLMINYNRTMTQSVERGSLTLWFN